MIKKIVHLSDVHIRKSIKRHGEYSKIFKYLYDTLQKIKPDRIVLVGDLYNDYIDLEGEAQILMASFLNNLSKIADVKITRGNHDCRKSALNRMDTIETITKLINNPSVEYYGRSGFYQDDNVTWCVWNHRDIIKNPWFELQHKKVKGQTYIDLFHDPVNGCLSHNGSPLKGDYISINDFKGDYSMFGDIHLYQTFKNNTKAYSSSLIQQNFGELPNGHGFILWDISKGIHEFIEIPNDHVYINFEVGQDTDYNDLKLSSPYIRSENEFKVKWCDISSNVNKENEVKIKQFLLNTYGAKFIKIERNPIIINLTDGSIVSESVDMNDKNVVRSIFVEYLKNNKYDDAFIKEVLILDDIINDRIEFTEHENLEWKLCSTWFDNFKSYGDDNQIEWSDLNGVTKISGLNQQGKTTILDVITYVLYGKTIGTDFKQKFAENKFINNKRNLDYCEAGVIILINDQYYTIVRRTERNWDSKKTKIVSCPTKVTYYLGTEIKEENKLNDETKDRTTKVISKALGTFDDFVRLSLTTGDNLNSLLSADRSDFIDAIIKDAGYDIFETKLVELKKYIDSLDEDKIVIMLSDENEKIKNNKSELESLNKILQSSVDDKADLSKEITKITGFKESELKKLHKIDTDVSTLNVSSLVSSTDSLNVLISANNIKINSLIEDNKKLPDSFDENELVIVDIELKNKNILISALDVSNSELKNEYTIITNKESELESNLKNLINTELLNLTSKINQYELKIESSKKKISDMVNVYIDDVKNKMIALKNEISLIDVDLTNIKDKGVEGNKQKSELEESSICPTCGQKMTSEHFEHIKGKIVEISENIKIWKENYLEKVELKKPKVEEYNKYNSILEEIKNKDFTSNQTLKSEYENGLTEYKSLKSDLEICKSQKETISNGDYSKYDTIINLITENKKLVEQYSKSKLEIQNKNLKYKSDRSELLIEIEKIEANKKIIAEKQSNYNLNIRNVSTISKLELENSNYNTKILSNELLIEKYNNQLSSIKANELINSEIDAFNLKIKELTTKSESFDRSVIEANKKISILSNDILEIEKKIVKYKEQQKRDEIRKVYKSSVHRDGLPTYLLKKSIGIINTELNNLLGDVDFTIFFDDELVLKMCADDFSTAWQNAVESSGKERTFAAIALKLALRKVNNRSKPDMMIFDEVTGKLIENSVEEFIEFLDKISKEIGKILIIEHIHPIMFDHSIEVTKNEKGISSLTIN